MLPAITLQWVVRTTTPQVKIPGFLNRKSKDVKQSNKPRSFLTIKFETSNTVTDWYSDFVDCSFAAFFVHPKRFVSVASIRGSVQVAPKILTAQVQKGVTYPRHPANLSNLQHRFALKIKTAQAAHHWWDSVQFLVMLGCICYWKLLISFIYWYNIITYYILPVTYHSHDIAYQNATAHCSWQPVCHSLYTSCKTCSADSEMDPAVTAVGRTGTSFAPIDSEGSTWILDSGSKRLNEMIIVWTGFCIII